MLVTKKISKDNELYLYFNGKLIFKKWLDQGYSKIFDVMAYDSYTYASYTDLDVENSPHIINVKAKVRFKTTAEGGRRNDVVSGYRPNHVFVYREDGHFREAYMGELQFTEPEWLTLGETYEIMVRFPLAQRIEHFLEVGRKWWIHEAQYCVGEAEVLEFINS